jgi:hypothetical protein
MSTPSQDNRRSDDRFDEAMRALHASAVAHVSPQLRWKLRPAPRVTGGVAGRFGNWRAGPLAAGAVAAALAVAIGLGLRGPHEPAAIAPVAAVAPDTAAAGVLDQDPDFYAWLASEDAELVATLE